MAVLTKKKGEYYLFDELTADNIIRREEECLGEEVFAKACDRDGTVTVDEWVALNPKDIWSRLGREKPL